MVGAIVGGALKVAGGIANAFVGAKSRRRQARQQKAIFAQKEKDNQTWYDKNYNDVSTERAEAVSSLERMREGLAERSKDTAGVSAVMGGTNASAFAEKQAQTNALGNTISNIALAGEQRKENVESKYMENKDNIRNSRLDAINAMEQDRRQSSAAAAQSMSQGGGAIASAFKK